MDDATKKSIATLKGNYTSEMKAAASMAQRLEVWDKYAEKFREFKVRLVKPSQLREAIDKRDFNKLKTNDKYKAVLWVIGDIFKSDAEVIEAIEKVNDTEQLKKLLTSTFSELTAGDMERFSEEQRIFLTENGYEDRKEAAFKPMSGVTYETAATYAILMGNPEFTHVEALEIARKFYNDNNPGMTADAVQSRRTLDKILRLYAHPKCAYIEITDTGYKINPNAEVR